MAIADVYDALISIRPYKKALSVEEAARIIESGKGAHFDPVLVDVFLKVSDQFAEIAERFNSEELERQRAKGEQPVLPGLL